MANKFKPMSETEAVKKICKALFSSNDKRVKLLGSNIIRDNLLQRRLIPKARKNND